MAVRPASFPHVLSSACARKGEMNIQCSEALGSAGPACGLNDDPHFLLAPLTFSHSRNHQPRTLTTETPRKSTRSWNRRGERGLGGRAVLGGGPYPRSSSWTKGAVCRDPHG